MPNLNKGIKLTADSSVIKLNNRVFETIQGTAFITIRPDVVTANGMVTLLDPGITNAGTDAGYISVSINHVDQGLPIAGFYWVIQTLGSAGHTINTLQSDRVSYGAESTLGLTYDATAGTLKFALNSVDTVFTPSNNGSFTAGVSPVVSGLGQSPNTDALETIGIDNYSGFLSKIATYSSVFSAEDLKKYTDDPTNLPTKDRVLSLDATQLNAVSKVNNSVPEVQKLTFGAAAASGVITIDGSAGLNNGAKVVVSKGDSGATIAAKVQTALSESLLFKPQLEKQLVTFSPNTSPATSFLVAGVPVTVGAATYETQTVTLTANTTATGPVSFLGVPTASLTAGTVPAVTATAITAAKAAILGGPIARAAGLTDISNNGAVLTLTFGGPGGTGDVGTLATSPVSNGVTFGPSVDVVTGVASTDTAATTATAVKAALDASALIRGASALGRSIVNNGDGSLTITYNSADGDAKPLVIDSKTTTVKASVDTVQTYNAAGAVGRTVTVDGASVLITASAADQNLPDLFTNQGSTGVSITFPNLAASPQTKEFTSFVPSTFNFEGAPLGEIQRMTFTAGAAGAGEQLSFVINGVTQTAVIPVNPLGAGVAYTTAATAEKIAELLTASIANLTNVDKVTASGDFVDVHFKSVAGNVAYLTITSVTARAILTTPQQFAQNLAGETQTVSFTTAQSSGNIIVDGITVAIVSGDTPSQIATKVQKALVDSGISDAGITSSMYSIPETQAITFTNAAASAGTITVNGVTVTLLATDNTPEMIAAKAALALNSVANNNYFASADGDTLLVMFDNAARDAQLMTGLVPGTRTGDTATAFSTRTEFDPNGLRTSRVNSDGSLGIDLKPWEGTTAERGNIAPVKAETTGNFVAEKQTVAVTGTTGADVGPVVFLGIPTADIAAAAANTVVATAIETAKASILAGSQAQALGLTDISASAALLTLTFGGPGGLGDVPNIAANTVASNGVTFGAGAQIAVAPETQTVLIEGPATAATPVTFLGVATGNPAGTTITNVGDAIVTAKAAILAGSQAVALGLSDISNSVGTLTLTYGNRPGNVPEITAKTIPSNGVTFGAGVQVQASTAPTNYPTTASVATTAEAHAQKFTSSSYTGAVIANVGAASSSNAMYAELVSVGEASADSKQLVFDVFLESSLKSKAAIGTGYESVGFTLNYSTTDIDPLTVKVDMAASKSSAITNLNTPGMVVARWLNSESVTDFTKPIARIMVDQNGSLGAFKDKLDLTFSSVDVDGLDLTDGTSFTRTIDESLRSDRWDVEQKLVYGIDKVTPVGGVLVGYYGNLSVVSPVLSLKYSSFKDPVAAGVVGGAVTPTLTNPNKTLALDVVSGVAGVRSADFVIELPSDVINPTFTLSPAAVAAGLTLTPANGSVVQGLVGHYYNVKLSTTNLAGLAKDATIGTLSMDLIKGKDKTFEFLLGDNSALNSNKVVTQGVYFGYTATEETKLNLATGLAKGEWMAKDMPKGTFNKFFVDTAPSMASKVITAADALQILKLSAGYGLDWKPGAIPDAAIAAADMDGSGKITAADALIALKYASGVIPATDPVVRKFYDSATANLTVESTTLASLKKDMVVAGGANVEIGIANANKDFFVEAILVGNLTNPALEI